MPEDVKIVEDENGEERVPTKGHLVLSFLLKVDMTWDSTARPVGSTLVVHRGGHRPMAQRNVFRRLKPPITGALYVRFLPFLHTCNVELISFPLRPLMRSVPSTSFLITWGQFN
jgi:hypothetical protein